VTCVWIVGEREYTTRKNARIWRKTSGSESRKIDPSSALGTFHLPDRSAAKKLFLCTRVPIVVENGLPLTSRVTGSQLNSLMSPFAGSGKPCALDAIGGGGSASLLVVPVR
jgi:hypothetical protein